MSSAENHHAEGVLHFQAGRLESAAKCLRDALWQEESAELWNDWAAVEFASGRVEEAETGFRLALEIEPANGDAALNLAALFIAQSRHQEATALLKPRLDALSPESRQLAEQLLEKIRQKYSLPMASVSELQRYLRGFVSGDANEQSYFETHLRRYLKTLELLPQGKPGMRLLELGAAFHHVTPALIRFKGYEEVRCNDIWQGEAQETRRIASRTGQESFSFTVDNFDVQMSPWPYPDQAFAAVLCCEMLEHLHSDPMGVLTEVNRVLKDKGFLLLTTPNLAAGHSVEFVLKNESPYVYGKFEAGGGPTDRHNREYTAGEVGRLAEAAGFGIEVLRTENSWWDSSREILRLLAARGFPIARRGDNTFLLARKSGPVRDRHPEEFYLTLGTQAKRRAVRSAEPSPAREDSNAATSPHNILVIHELVPQFDRSGSDLRLSEVLQELRAQGHWVTLLARDGRDAERYSIPLEELGIEVIAGDADRMRHVGIDAKTPWTLREKLQQGKFHVAILCHWFWSGISIPENYLEEIRSLSPGTRIAILTDDCHGQRECRSAALTGQLSDLERGNNFESRELEMYRRADLLLYISEADRRRFADRLPDLPMEYLPVVAQEAIPQAGFEKREGVLFLGNFENLANRDALDWMLQKVWPQVRKNRPNLNLYVAGHGAPEGVEKDHAGVIQVGHAADLAALFEKRLVFAAPVRFGTGINTKNLQALSRGVPVVTTLVGAEGLGLRHEEHALIADSPQDFAKCILRLVSDEILWKSLASRARDFVHSRFSHDQLKKQIRIILRRLDRAVPKDHDPEFIPSYRAVERLSPEVLTAVPARYRMVLRPLAYWRLGVEHLSAGRFAEALAQLRHVFAGLRGPIPATAFHARLLSDMAEVYRKTGDRAAAARCASESQRLISSGLRSLLPDPPPKRVSGRKQNRRPDISVVLPTYNRKEVLRLCLSALALQTLPAEQWEVIVVDDGSTDGTKQFYEETTFPFSLRCLRQENQGAGAARRAGVETARGEYVLLINDDTIVSSNLLTEHLNMHRRNPREKWAVLGNFLPSDLCAERALSLWVNLSPFFFPQQNLKPGQLCGAAFFVTCNLSIRRDALMAAGNFNPHFRVAEDTEMGARLAKRGYRVRYHPEARAIHEHGRFILEDLLKRAQSYGAADCLLFALHPELLGSGDGPFGKLEEPDLRRIAFHIIEKREAVTAALPALQALENLDLRPFWASKSGQEMTIDPILKQLATLVPLVYWYHLFESFLSESRKSPRFAVASPAPTIQTAETS